MDALSPLLLCLAILPLTEALSVVDRVASAVGMKLGLKKCGVAHVQKGRVLPGPQNPSTMHF